MCCRNNPKMVREILKKYGPNEYLYGYKVLQVHYNGKYRFGFTTPYQQHDLKVSDLVSGVVRAALFNRLSDYTNRRLRGIDIEAGIHIFKTLSKAEGICTYHPDRKIFKVYGKVSDLMGVDHESAVFTKILYDREGVAEVLKNNGF